MTQIIIVNNMAHFLWMFLKSAFQIQFLNFCNDNDVHFLDKIYLKRAALK